MAAPRFKENFEGRIRNLALTPSKPSNSLVPLFEAVSNSLHAIDKRFAKGALENGRISIHVERAESTTSIIIKDNGIGLDHDNFEAFLTLDTSAKMKIGGKGIGRLTWLKVFDNAAVVSRFQAPSGHMRRSFKFTLEPDGHLQNYSLSKVEEELGTEIHLNEMKTEYHTHCPSKIETIAKKLIAHFFPAFFANKMPAVIVSMGDETILLNEFIHEKIHRAQKSIYEYSGERVQIEHSLIDKAISDHFDHHTLQFSANDRIVEEHDLDNQIGISTYIHLDELLTRYIGVVTSKLLDENVSQERNRFDIPTEIFDDFKSHCVDSVKSYLAKEIEEVIGAQKEKLDIVMNNFPRFTYLVDDKDSFVRENLPLNANNEENIFRQLSVLDFRASRDISSKVKGASSPEMLAALEVESKNLVTRVQQQERAALLEYVAKRKLVLDLLSKYQGYDDEKDRLNYLELAIHQIVCPTKVTNGDIEIFDHNLWVLDDRLTFYEFWASDKQIRTFANQSDSLERPDIILFQGNALFHRMGTSQPVVIVEFKRPARPNYSDDENPITQIYSYIRELQGKEVRDKEGALITTIDNQTPFFCYVIADVTKKLDEYLKDSQINKPLPGGRGFFGFHPDYNAYIEVIHYSTLISDARIRNEIFFKKLGIN